MALRANKNLPTGIVANYWKITMIALNPQTMQMSVGMSLFLNQASTELTPIISGAKSYTFSFNSNQFTSNIPAYAYSQIKEYLVNNPDSDLANASDV